MNRNLAVGLFVLIGLALFTAGLFLIGDRHEAFQKHITLYTEFADLSGLASGSKVQVGGMDAGQIEEISVPDSPSSKFRVKFQIGTRFHGLVRSDSTATIATEGIVGDTFLSIGPGSEGSPAAISGTTLGSKEPLELAALLSQAQGSLSDVDTTMRDADKLMTFAGGDLAPTLATAHKAMADADDILVGLKQGDGTAGMLLRDRALANSIKRTVANTEQVTNSLRGTADRANTLLGDVASRNFPQKIDDTLAALRDTASNFDATSKSVKQTVAELTEPDEHGVSVGANLRETISNVNTATGNLADDTEALKHSFLVRGFFRKRGYYTLTNISPAEYRHDPLSTSAANQRTWVSADQLFHRNSKDVEELTPAGKQILDHALAIYGDTLLSNPIVVEGYSTDASLAERVELSRARAIAVRNYIIQRFQLDPMTTGGVALDDQAPQGAGRATWDGVSIVLLSKAH